MAERKLKSKVQKAALKDSAIDDILSGKEVKAPQADESRKELINRCGFNLTYSFWVNKQ